MIVLRNKKENVENNVENKLKKFSITKQIVKFYRNDVRSFF